jgi:hypothetical protein
MNFARCTAFKATDNPTPTPRGEDRGGKIRIMVTKLEDRIEGQGEVKGFVFTKEFENEKGYVYKVSTGDSNHFEAFYKKETPICIDFENRVYSETETKEVYPKSKDFGVWAWSVSSLEKAIVRLS